MESQSSFTLRILCDESRGSSFYFPCIEIIREGLVFSIAVPGIAQQARFQVMEDSITVFNIV